MATFKSAAFIGGNIHRVTDQGTSEISATILIPSGTSLASADLLKFFKIGANHKILEVTLETSDLDSNGSPAVTLDLGYDLPSGADDDDAFLANSTIGQAGGQVRVENGGDDPFAVGLLAAQTETMTIQAKVETAPATNPSTDRYVTCRVVFGANTGVPSVTPEYVYANRYNSSGQATL